MVEKNIDKPLDDILTNKATSKRLVKEDGSIEVPGTPIILPGRGVEPKENEYIDTISNEGVTNDLNRVESLKVRSTKEVVENQLLGNFDGNGVYKVSEEIGKELINMVKVIESVEKISNEKFIEVDGVKIEPVDGLIYCESASAFSGLGNFKFAIQTYYQPPIAISELFLLEDVKKVDGLIQNVNIYSAGKFKDVFSGDYKTQMFQFFNIVSKEMAVKMAEEDKLIFGWAYRRRLYLKTIFSLGDSRYMLAEATYLAAKIEALSHLGAFGARALSTFKEIQEKAKKIVSKELNARDLNDLLDLTIDQLTEKYPEMSKQYHATIIADTKNFQNEIKVISQTNSEEGKKFVNKTIASYELKYGKANSAYKPEVSAPKYKSNDKKKEVSNTSNPSKSKTAKPNINVVKKVPEVNKVDTSYDLSL